MSVEDDDLRVRAAWYYYVGGFNQEKVAQRLGVTRARVNKMLAEARESGLVSISIDHQHVGVLPVEDLLVQRYGLDFCISTPAFGFHDTSPVDQEARKQIAFRAVGVAAANYLKKRLTENEAITVGTGWGRTIEQMTLQLAGVQAPRARFISVMGSLTPNSAYNPFEVVQRLARRTGARGFFLPVPFIVNSVEDRRILLSQRSVIEAMTIAEAVDVCIISAGELTEDSLMFRQGMINQCELDGLRASGAVADANGLFFDQHGRQARHSLNQRTIALDLAKLQSIPVIVLIAGQEKIRAADGLLKSGIINGLIIDGDTAQALAASDFG